jgi:sugar/nucleoside kinase (ribokinase family)
MNTPDFVIIGHVTRDIVADGWRLGGTAAYAAVTASRLGRNPAVVTSAASDLDAELRLRLGNIPIQVKPSGQSTSFENTYTDRGRTQLLRAKASNLTIEDVPKAWREAPLVLLAPVADELTLNMAADFPHAFVGATPQGWMRCWNENGQIRYQHWEPSAKISNIGAVILSEEDLSTDADVVQSYRQVISIMAITKGHNGVDIYWQGKQTHIPAFSAVERDPTGAGDVFASAFLVRLTETSDPLKSANFANCVASFAVETEGMADIPNRYVIENRLRRGSQ